MSQRDAQTAPEEAKATQRCLELADRVALRIEEASEAIGLSPRAFREHILARCPKFYAGKAVLIPTRRFEKFIEELSVEEEQAAAETAAELLASAEEAS